MGSEVYLLAVARMPSRQPRQGRGLAGSYRPASNAEEMLLVAFKRHAGRQKERRLQRRLAWLLGLS